MAVTPAASPPPIRLTYYDRRTGERTTVALTDLEFQQALCYPITARVLLSILGPEPGIYDDK